MRAAAEDLMQGFRFHVTAQNKDGDDPLEFTELGDTFGQAQAGFQSVTIPEVTTEAVEYREGTSKWTQKYPGPPTVSDCTLMRGVAMEDTTFFTWVMSAVDGKEYRSDVTIWHYQRAEMDQAAVAGVSNRRYLCGNAFATRAKPSGDFDSTSGEVSLAEVDFAMESLEIQND